MFIPFSNLSSSMSFSTVISWFLTNYIMSSLPQKVTHFSQKSILFVPLLQYSSWQIIFHLISFFIGISKILQWHRIIVFTGYFLKFFDFLNKYFQFRNLGTLYARFVQQNLLSLEPLGRFVSHFKFI